MRFISSMNIQPITNIGIAVISALSYSLWLLGYSLNKEVMNKLDLSALQSVGQPHWKLFVMGDVLTGIGCIILGVLLIKTLAKTRYIKFASTRVCIAGLMVFGLFTAVSSILPSCINESQFCNVNPSNIFDFHDLTGGLASFGLFFSLVALVQLTDNISNILNKATIFILFIWAISAVLFVSLSFELNTLSIAVQQIFLMLSSLSIVIIPIIINMILKIETS